MRQLGYLPELYEDARSGKYKMMSFVSTNVFDVDLLCPYTAKSPGWAALRQSVYVKSVWITA